MDYDKLQEIRNINAVFIHNKYGHNKIIQSEDIYAYQEMIRLRYPDKWSDLYEDKWPVRIIYYDKKNIPYIYHFYVNRHLNMENTLFLFKKFLECQKLAICNCFGIDVGTNIIECIPTLLYIDELINNFIYVHLRRPYWRGKLWKLERVRVPNNMTINKTHGQITLKGIQQYSRYTVLRIRAIPVAIIENL